MKKNRIKLIIIIVLIIAVLGVILYFGLKDKKGALNKDSLKFKNEYEALNDTKASNGKVYPKVELKDNNPFVYATAKEVVSTLENGTGLIYLGFPNCPWCRNAINVLQHVNTDKILYLNMTDERDAYEVKEGVLNKIKDGTDEYYEMLKALDSILSDYEVDGIKTGEKRIYVPLVIGVKEGQIVGYHADTVELPDGQTPYDLLTKKQQSDLKLIYDEINVKVNDDTCGMDEDHGC